METIEENINATQKVIDTWDGNSIKYKGIRYILQHSVTNSNDDLYINNPGIDDIDFNISTLFIALGFKSMIYGYGFKQI